MCPLSLVHPISFQPCWNFADEILQVLLPEELREGSPTGFAATGHIGMFSVVHLSQFLTWKLLAHVNLNDEYLPYKYLIGQLILDVREARIPLEQCSYRYRKTKGSRPS